MLTSNPAMDLVLAETARIYGVRSEDVYGRVRGYGHMRRTRAIAYYVAGEMGLPPDVIAAAVNLSETTVIRYAREGAVGAQTWARPVIDEIRASVLARRATSAVNPLLAQAMEALEAIAVRHPDRLPGATRTLVAIATAGGAL